MNTIVLGLKQFFMNAFGTIPGPILFGTVIDATCSYWHTDSQNQSVCKIYIGVFSACIARFNYFMINFF